MKILWQPSEKQIRQANLTAFRRVLNDRHGSIGEAYAELHAWSVKYIPDFWEAVWDFCDVSGKKGNVALQPGEHMMEARFFPDARLNFAENVLRRRGGDDAIVFALPEAVDPVTRLFPP